MRDHTKYIKKPHRGGNNYIHSEPTTAATRTTRTTNNESMNTIYIYILYVFVHLQLKLEGKFITQRAFYMDFYMHQSKEKKIKKKKPKNDIYTKYIYTYIIYKCIYLIDI